MSVRVRTALSGTAAAGWAASTAPLRPITSATVTSEKRTPGQAQPVRPTVNQPRRLNLLSCRVVRGSAVQGSSEPRYYRGGRACAPHQITGEHDPNGQGASLKERHGTDSPRGGRIVVGSIDGHCTTTADPPHATGAVLTRSFLGLLHNPAHRVPAVDLLWIGGRNPSASDPQRRRPARRNHRNHRRPPVAPPDCYGFVAVG